MNRIDKLGADHGELVNEEGHVFPYRIVKSSRRTLAVTVGRDGEIAVRIPAQLSTQEGHAFAIKNQAWIFIYAGRIRESVEKRAQFCWEEGASLLYQGEERVLRLELDYEAGRFRVCDTGEGLLVSGPFSREPDREAAAKAALINWYRRQAGRFLKERTAWWSQRMGVTYGRIAIRDQATRWGSCSGTGNINYNWKLVLVPRELADYVVVHELAHRKEMNHSKAFWKIIEGELPDYRQKRRKLKDYENKINQKYQD